MADPMITTCEPTRDASSKSESESPSSSMDESLDEVLKGCGIGVFGSPNHLITPPPDPKVELICVKNDLRDLIFSVTICESYSRGIRFFGIVY